MRKLKKHRGVGKINFEPLATRVAMHLYHDLEQLEYKEVVEGIKTQAHIKRAFLDAWQDATHFKK